MATMTRRAVTTNACVVGAASLIAANTAYAGPPYITDDPEPVEHRHWELLLGAQTQRDAEGWSGTAPHFEVNYGVVPNLQLHVIAPSSYVAPLASSFRYGYGDTELGAKLRFVQEGKWAPQVGTFPLVELPTGSRRRGLGNGSAQVFVPVWLQKSFGKWTSYGGGGLWFDTGGARDHFWYLGWQVQRSVTDALTLGAELLHLGWGSTPSDTRYNVGAVLDFGPTHHLLLSAGQSIVGPIHVQGYIAWLVTLGPAAAPEPRVEQPREELDPR